MANPTRRDGKPRRAPAKGGEKTVKGRLRRSKVAKANPEVDQSTWRQKLRTASISFDDVAKEIFLTEFAKHGRKQHASEAAGTTLHTVRSHQKNDPEFAKAYDQAGEKYRDQFVAHAIGDLATKGVPVMAATKDGDGNVEIYEQRRDYPIPIIILELRRVDPAYRDKQELEVNGGGGILVVPGHMTPAEWVADQERKNAERKNPMEKETEAETIDGKSSTPPAEVTLPDRAAVVAARNAKSIVR